jgi:hypothetical protein
MEIASPLDCTLRFLRPAVVTVLLAIGTNLLSPDPTGATALKHPAGILRFKFPLTSLIRHYDVDHNFGYAARLLALWKKFLALGGSINGWITKAPRHYSPTSHLAKEITGHSLKTDVAILRTSHLFL